MPTKLRDVILICSFCGKGADQVRHLRAGPGPVYICGDCAEACNEIIEGERQR